MLYKHLFVCSSLLYLNFPSNAHIIRLMNVMLTVRSVFRQFDVNCTEVFGSYDSFVFLDFICLWFIINCEMRY